MTKIEKAHRLDAFLSNDDNFVVVSRAEYEASPGYAASQRYHAAKAKRVAANRTAAVAALSVGQSVLVRGSVFGAITAIDGQNVTLTVTKSLRGPKFAVGSTFATRATCVEAA